MIQNYQLVGNKYAPLMRCLVILVQLVEEVERTITNCYV